MNVPFWTVVLAIIRKDLQIEFRSRELIGTMGVFALMSVFVFSFALELDRIARQEVISGVLWVTVFFSSILGLSRNLTIEREQGSLDAMLLAPIPRNAIFVGKLLGNFVFTLIVGIILLPVMFILFNLPTVNLAMVGILCLGILAISIIGTLLATITIQTRAREVLLPIVLLPVSLPIIIVVVRATTEILHQRPLEDWLLWLQILVGILLIYTVLSLLTFEYVIED
jgi:heme exporter protein B